jgi:hypothetical protein
MSRALCKLDALRTVLLVSPLAVAMLMTACAPEGAGSIHIKASREQRERTRTSAGPGIAADAKPSPVAAPRNTPRPSTNKRRTNGKG